MSEFSREDAEQRKRAVFDSMSPRRQKSILKRGYEKWDPFEAPNDPIDIRKDKTQRTSQQLITEFMHSADHETYSNAFGRGAFELCLGIINGDEKSLGMFAFACWYKALLDKEGADGG